MKKKSRREYAEDIKPEQILKILQENGHAMTARTIVQMVGAPKSAKAGLKLILKQLERDGQIEKERNRYGLPGGMGGGANTVTGKVELKADFGFLIVEEGDDIFLGRTAVMNLMPGDVVEVQVRTSRQGGREGLLKKIVKRGDGPFMCRVKMLGNQYFASLVFKESPFIKLKPTEFDLKPNDIVLLTIEETPKGLKGEVISHLDDSDNIDMHKLFILNKHDIRMKFPDEVMQEASRVERNEDQLGKRTDLRGQNIITIDPFDAKDYDDAVSLYEEGGNFHLGVHIADVTHYLKEGSPMDVEAYKRALSTYLPGEVIPMLPERLSNDMCSLVEGKDRLTFSVFMEINKEGVIVDYDIKESIINNRMRLSYEQAEDIIQGKLVIKDTGIRDMLVNMNRLKGILRQKMIKDGMVDFSLGEPVMTLGEGFKVRDIKRKIGLDSHKLIEYAMISANVCAADFITKHYSAGMFRIHPPPAEKDLTDFNSFLAAMGVSARIKKGKNEEFQNVEETIKDHEKKYFIERKLLRAMQLATYSEVNRGHFGLALEKYTHFTSPIRRYADVIVHRLIKNALGIEFMKDTDKAYLKTAAQDISEREEHSEKAENDVFRLYALNFLKDRLGEPIKVIVSRLTKNGFVVELEEFPIEGFINFDTMQDDYYLFDEERHIVVGRRTRKLYKLGDKISAIIVKITLETLKMDLEME
jgi:ribonuclease R